jgi:asparagine synthase (glutamine-hydrolysing)
MSAIFGIWSFEGKPVGEMDVRAMASCLAHRGPDGTGLWREGTVGLGHNKLATTPESIAEDLPLSGDGKRAVITADARIDNRKELLALLRIDARQEETIGDARLILAAYERWGVDAPKYLVGDFAFAIWDSGRQTLFCARDPMGIKPLYYHHSSRVFVFASEIKAAIACPDVPRRLNEMRVADHLQWNFDDAESTFYKGVVRLPAAHSLTVTTESVRLRRYWSLDCAREVRLRSASEYADAFREMFVEAVRCRTRSAFGVGSTLSGGLDSSSIACTANRLLPVNQGPLRTFSAIFPSLPERELRRIDERPYVEAVLRSGSFDQSYVWADRASPLSEWHRTLAYLDGACLAPNLYLHWELYKAAAGKGVRVLLDGLDGDTTVSHGLGYLADLVRTGRWRWFLNEARALSQRSSCPLPRVVWRFGIRPLVPEPFARAWRALRQRPRAENGAPDMINRTLALRVQKGDKARKSRQNCNAWFESSRQGHCRALGSPLIPYAIEFADAVSSTLAIEVRYPFFDQRLIEFCLSIPAEQKLHHGWTRAVMRHAMSGILPPEVQWRVDKADLSFNFKRGLFERDRPIITDMIMSRPQDLEEYVDLQVVHDTYRRWSEQPLRSVRDALTLHTVATLALWLEVSGFRRTTKPANGPT